LVQNKKVLEFVSENGQELARHMFFTVHNEMDSTTDYFWNIFKNSHIFQQKDHALFAALLTFLSIRIEIEMQAIYSKYGDDVYSELGEHVSSYYQSFLVNFAEDEEDLAMFLMHQLLAVQFKKVAATEVEISSSIFQPFVPILSEGGSVVDIIESDI